MNGAQQPVQALYNIERWSEGYFSVNDAGHLVARPDAGDSGQAIDLYELAREIDRSGLDIPVLVRFSDILHHRARLLDGAFRDAMRRHDYVGGFTPAYPIKVNQQRHVIEELLGTDGISPGLETGSKPELLASLALAPPGGTIICNGYKDAETINLALTGLALGLDCYIVIERPTEVELVIRAARETGIRPLLGVRVRLASVGFGKWQNSGGERSKFGLTAAQVSAMIEQLREAGLLDCLRMMHFHMGSQIPDLQDIRHGLAESGRYYAQLCKAGAPLTHADIGGGLGIDYEGTGSRNFCSMNYDLDGYADAVVDTFARISAEHSIAPPHIITESGRAMTAHHAMIITEVIDVERAPHEDPAAGPVDDGTGIIDRLQGMLEPAGEMNPVKTVRQLQLIAAEARAQFAAGGIDLAVRALAEQLDYRVSHRLRETLSADAAEHTGLLAELNAKLADKYFCNFSLFQSIPDAWALDQVFPVMPIHRLDEAPLRRGVIMDLTCDSDGQIEQYADGIGIEPSLPLHEVRPGEPYLLGIFLVGAYQEILGDLHNLFGDLHSVHVEMTEDGGHRLAEPLRGDTVASVLEYVNISREDLRRGLQKHAGAAHLDADHRQRLLDVLEASLEAYTYLDL